MDVETRLVGDEERDRALIVLKGAYGDGRLTFEEFADLTALAIAGRTSGELQATTADLARPALIPSTFAPIRRIISLWRPSEHRATWRAVGNVSVVAAWAPSTLDLRRARIEGDELSIKATALWSPVTIIVPHGVDIEVTSGGMFRDRRTHISNSGPLPGAPRIHLKATSLWADVILTD